MKFLAVLFVIAIAFGCQGLCWKGNPSSNEGTSGENNNWQTSQEVDEQVSSILAASQQDIASILANQQWNNFAEANPEAAPYQQKIVQRIQNTPSFASKPNVQQNILKLALEKLQVCKSFSPQLPIDRNCLGSSVGQMMQLISAIENVSRNHPSGRYPNEQY